MPMNPRLLRPTPTGFDPRRIANLGAWFDASDLSTLSQTSDGATPVTANNDPVAYFKCKVTGTPLTQAIDANRPLWKAASSIGSKPALEFDGSNDVLFATSGGLMDVTRNVSGATAFYVLRSDNQSTRAYWTVSVGGASNFFRVRAFAAYIGGLSCGGRRLDADASESILSTFAASTNYIARQTHDYANASLQVHLNGTLGNSSSAFQTAGNTSDAASAYVMLGSQFTNEAFTAIATPFDGIICEWLIYRRALTAAEAAKVEGYLAWKWGLQSQLPYDHPYARSFPGFGSQTLPTDPDAQTYLAAVAAADGTGVEVGVANAVDDFVKGCKSDGIWDAIKASCILAGARTLAGALTPLKGAAPTNNGPFVSGDYDRKIGLLGNGTSKYLDTNRNVNADPQDNFHMAIYKSAFAVGGPVFGAGAASTGSTQIQGGAYRCRTSTGYAPAVAMPAEAGFVGMSRVNGSTFIGRNSGTSETFTAASQSPFNGNAFVYARNSAGTPGLFIAHRYSYYSIGESLNLASLDARVSALVTAIGAAIP